MERELIPHSAGCVSLRAAARPRASVCGFREYGGRHFGELGLSTTEGLNRSLAAGYRGSWRRCARGIDVATGS